MLIVVNLHKRLVLQDCAFLFKRFDLSKYTKYDNSKQHQFPYFRFILMDPLIEVQILSIFYREVLLRTEMMVIYSVSYSPTVQVLNPNLWWKDT